MKKTLLISLICLATSVAGFAQDASQSAAAKPAVCRRDKDMPKGAVPAWPTTPYVATQSPECAPCYTYTSKHGVAIMECPFLYFLPENGAPQSTAEVTVPSNGDLNIVNAKAYTGKYQVCRRDIDMPKGAVPAWPKSAYVSMQPNSECAPCYEYTSKHGVRIMECPFLHFLPETSK